METLLIKKADFLPYRNISANINEAKQLDSFILEAQRLDLIGLLGRKLYFKLISVYTTYLERLLANATYLPTAEETAFKDLLRGKKYVDSDQNDINYLGLVPVLVYLTYARFVRSSHIQSTSSGFVRKTHEFAEAISSKEVQEQASRAETDASAFLNFVFEYLGANEETFKDYVNVSSDTCVGSTDLRRIGTRLRSVRGKSITQRR